MEKKLEFFIIPHYVVFGSHATDMIPEILQRLEITSNSKILLITGPTITYDIAMNLVHPRIEEITGNVQVIKISREVPSTKYLISLRSEVRKSTPTLIVAVGGGSVIDYAKVLAHWFKVPYITVPTSASHDGIASPAISYLLRKRLTEEVGGDYSVLKPPIAVIADIEVILKAPYRLLAAGCGDLVAKITAVRDWKLAHRLKGEDYSEYAASLAVTSAKLVMSKAEYISKITRDGVRAVVKALIGCGVAMSIAGSSRPCSGAEHLFSHALDYLAEVHGFKPAHHGEQVGVGSILMAYLHGMKWQRIRAFLKKIKAPTTARELGIEPKYIVKALTIAHTIRPERYTILGSTGVSEKAAWKIVKVTGVVSEEHD